MTSVTLSLNLKLWVFCGCFCSNKLKKSDNELFDSSAGDAFFFFPALFSNACVLIFLWNYSCFVSMQLNIWSYSSRSLLHSIETGHSANIFCTKFVPETSDELVVSGAGDAEVIFKSFHMCICGFCLCAVRIFWWIELVFFLQVRLFNLSRVSGRGPDDISPTATYHCHTRRVKKLAVRYLLEIIVKSYFEAFVIFMVVFLTSIYSGEYQQSVAFFFYFW